MPKIFILGRPGSGKTTTVRELSQLFDVEYIELDLMTFPS
jgi:adenylate kinase family enzyme